MNFIPILHFISAIALFGLVMYFFNPIVDEVHEVTGLEEDDTVYTTAMFFFFDIIAAVNLFGAGIRFVIFMQGDKE